MTGRGAGRGRPGEGQDGSGSWNSTTRHDPREVGERPVLPPVSAGGGAHGRPEVEELPAQAVLARSSARLGLSGVFAVGAMLILVAAGFGALGGRPQASPGATTAIGPTRMPPRATPIPVEPLVTPWARCTRGRTEVPPLSLAVNGTERAGRVEVLHSAAGEPLVTIDPQAAEPGRIDVRADEVTQLWIGDGSCALSWTIELSGFGILDTFDNATMDPALVAQNRFEIFFPPDIEGDLDLEAWLVFAAVSVRGTWPLHLTLLPRPRAELRWGGVDVPLTEGCDLFVWVIDRLEYPLTGCEGALSGDPPAAVRIPARREATFSIPGWSIDSFSDVVCVRVTDGFIEQHPEICSFTPLVEDGVLKFSVVASGPEELSGRWLLALQGCGNRFMSGGGSQACGTWYANVRFR